MAAAFSALSSRADSSGNPIVATMAALPWRGDAGSSDRPIDLPLPPRALPLLHAGRPLKRWRYVGVFGERAMLCVGYARVLGAAQAWWAVWDRERRVLRERTALVRPARAVRLARGRVSVRDGDVAIDVELDEVAGVETVCADGAGYVWTRKQAGIAARGTVRLGPLTVPIDARAVVDDTAGYHRRRTAWRWSAGVGEAVDGRRVGWNLVVGVNDPPLRSERTVWLGGAAREVGPVAFADDLSAVSFAEGGELRFAAEATRERHDELVVVRSDYVQPFGTFSGVLPGGVELTGGFGVMEDHRARW